MNGGVRGWFVTGTDTGVGKTRVAEALLRALRTSGRRAVGMKPVASGCRRTGLGLRNEDAERLLAAGSVSADYADVNPYAFEPPIAPHAAAARAGIGLDIGVVRRRFSRLAASAEWIVVEGAGGWYVPFDRHRLMSDVAHALALPVILVVGVRLGCINHALLTAAAIRDQDLVLAGWVANEVDPEFEARDETVAALRERMGAPCLARISFGAGAEPQPADGEILLARLLDAQPAQRAAPRVPDGDNPD